MKVLPVIHHLRIKTSIEQVELALNAGADGVFLISHGGQDDELDEVHVYLKARHPSAYIGVNYLSERKAHSAFSRAIKNEYSAVWIDNVGISSAHIDISGADLLAEVSFARLRGSIPEIFGSVAFKYQRPSTDPATDAYIAHRFGYIPTTSGVKTGEPPELPKISTMSKFTDGVLAVASGLTPQNLNIFKNHISHALVSTGISKDEYHLDEQRLAEFIKIAKD